jgi:transposase
MSGVKMLEPHWDAATAREAYRGERDAVRRSHLQVIWLLLSGEASSAVARVTGFSQRWVEKLVVRWNAEGPAGLGDQRRGNGATPVLDGAALVALAAALDEAPEDGGLWSGRKVAGWMSVYLGRPVDPKLGLDYLHRLGFSRQWPRPRHAKAAGPEAQEAFKKPRCHGGRGQGRGARPRGRAVGLRRASPWPEAARPAGLGQARPAPGGGQHAPIQMALSLWFRAAGDWRGRVVAGQ